MNTQFSEREKGFEAKFKIDQETNFKIEARRNKLLGLWLARQLGLPESEQEAYAKAVVLADLEEPGIEDVMRKVMGDIHERGAGVTEDDVRRKLTELHDTAHRQITSE